MDALRRTRPALILVRDETGDPKDSGLFCPECGICVTDPHSLPWSDALKVDIECASCLMLSWWRHLRHLQIVDSITVEVDNPAEVREWAEVHGPDVGYSFAIQSHKGVERSLFDEYEYNLSHIKWVPPSRPILIEGRELPIPWDLS